MSSTSVNAHVVSMTVLLTLSAACGTDPSAVPVNECAEGIDTCGSLTTCVDTDAGFDCVDDQRPTITLSAPSASDVLSGTVNIEWTTVDASPATVAIRLSIDSGSTYGTTLAMTAPDNGSFSWDTTAVADTQTARLQLIATDDAGNVSTAAESGGDFVIHNVGPAAPIVSMTTPAASETDLTPEVSGSAGAGTTVELFTDSSCATSTGVTGTAAQFASPGLTVTVAADSSTTFYAIGTDSFGLTSPCSSTSVTYSTEDITPPAAPTVTTSTPASGGTDLAPSIQGTAEAGTMVELFTDAICTASIGVTGSDAQFASPGLSVSVGPNTTTIFYATATDSAGNESPCASSGLIYTTVNAAPSPAAITGISPASPSNDLNPVVSGIAPAGTTVEVFTDSGCTSSTGVTGSDASFASPGLTVTVAGDATTTFFVQAIDSIGVRSICSTSGFSYTTDVTPPDPPTFTSTSPGSGGTDLTPGILGMAEAGSTVELFTDSACTSSTGVTGSAADFESPGLIVTVGSGESTNFYAIATDAIGNSSSCSTSTINYTHSGTNAPPAFPPFVFYTLDCHIGAESFTTVEAFDTDPLTYSEGGGSTCTFTRGVSADGVVSAVCPETATSCTIEVLADDGVNTPASANVTVSLLPRVFVDDAVASSGDGTTWATAFKTIEEGITAVAPTTGGVPYGDVWVKAGTYRAAMDATPVVSISGNPWLVGGFDGTSTDRADSDPEVNLTILDGDRDGGGRGADDSPQVVTATGFSGGRFEGFRVRNGNGTANGAGMAITGGTGLGNTTLISRCRFENNLIEHGSTSGQYFGGALYVAQWGVVVDNTVFTGNSITGSGTGNSAGGAIYVHLNAPVDPANETFTIRNSTFIGNSVSRPGGIFEGGAVYFRGDTPTSGSALVLNSLFAFNSIDNGGSFARGGAISVGTPSTAIINSTFAFNSVGTATTLSQGGAVDDANNPTNAVTSIVNSAFFGNTATASPHIFLSQASSAAEYSCVEGGFTGTGNTTLVSDPFTVDGERYYLNATVDGGALCTDAGLNSAADDSTTGYPSSSLDWRNLTTRLDLATETDIDGSGTEMVDAGVHYQP